jgi:hypothetical protein
MVWREGAERGQATVSPAATLTVRGRTATLVLTGTVAMMTAATVILRTMTRTIPDLN